MSLGGGRARRSARGCRGGRDSWSSVATPKVAPIMAALDGLEQRRPVVVLATLRLVELWRDHPPWRLLTRTADGRPGGLVVRSLPGSLVLPARRLATRSRQPGRAPAARPPLPFRRPSFQWRQPPACPSSRPMSRANSCNGLHQIRPAKRLEKATSSGQSRSRLSANSTSGTRMYKELAAIKVA